MKLDHLDLNLLLAFDVLASERSVTRAAARVGVSQPAMSGSLARLRAMFGDPLFVRADGHMAPTPRARQLAGPIGEALGRLRLAVEPAAAFQPGGADREFVIAATDYAETALLGRLVTAVRAVAPRIVLRTIRPQHAFAPPIVELRDGSADLSLGLTHEMPGPRSELRTAFLGRERMVGVLRAGHPHARRRLALREFARLPQIRVTYASDARRGLVDTLLAGHGLERPVALTVSNLSTVPSIVAESDLLGIVPESLARHWARSRALAMVKLPIAMPPLSVAMAWHERRQADPALGWLRSVVERTCGDAPRRTEAPVGARTRAGSGASRPESRELRAGARYAPAPRARPRAGTGTRPRGDR